MAETAPPCRRWGAVNVLMRLKNRIREKFFWDRILTDLDPADSSLHSTTSTQHDKESGKESAQESASHHDSVQFYDAMDGSEPQDYALFGQTFSEMLWDDGEGTMLYDPGEGRAVVTSYQQPEAFLTLADFLMDEEEQQQHQPWPPAAAEVDPTTTFLGRGFPSTTPAVPNEEYVDVLTELPGEELQDMFSAAATTSEFGRVETTTTETTTTEMMDTGESSSASSSSAIALQPAQWQQIMLLRQFMEVDGVVEPSGGWRVVLSIVSAFRRISDLVRIRRLQTPASGQVAVSTARRVGQGTRYKGIRQRNGKWVSEIRVAGTLEKVWLGSFATDKEAALAFDAGKHHCSARRSRTFDFSDSGSRAFNFADSPRLLGAPENLMHLSSVERRSRIQRLAEDHARTYGHANIR